MDILGKTEFDDGSISLQIKLSEEEREEWLVNIIALSYLLKSKTLLEKIVENDKSLTEMVSKKLETKGGKKSWKNINNE